MSVVDDIKDSFRGKDNSSSSGRDMTNDFDSGLDDSFDTGGSDTQLDPSSRSSSPQQGNQPQTGQQPSGNQNSLNSTSGNRNQGRGSQRQGGNAQNQRRNGTPNAQAGSPQQGSSQPQLSSQTRRKMDNAGLNSGRDEPQGRSRSGTAANSRDDFEELKSQNEQIIQLLQKINRNLERLGR